MKEIINWNNIRLFIAGEVHGVLENPKIKFDLFEFLYRQYGVRKIVLEMGYFDGLGINKYLQSGKEEILESVLRKYTGTYGGTIEETIFWKNIYRLNSEARIAQKIEAIGVDCIGEIDTIYRYLLFLLREKHIFSESDNKKINTLILKYKEFIKTKNYEGAKELELFFEEFINQDRENDSQNCYEFKKILNELIAHGRMICFPESRKEIREKYIYQNILDEMGDKGRTDNIFGQFGCIHVCGEIGNHNSAIERIESVFPKKCARILYVYKNSEYFFLKNGKKYYKYLKDEIEESGQVVFTQKINNDYSIKKYSDSDIFYVTIG